jgi:hypothetical protein
MFDICLIRLQKKVTAHPGGIAAAFKTKSPGLTETPPGGRVLAFLLRGSNRRQMTTTSVVN